MSSVTCYSLAAVSRSPSVSPGMRPRPWRQAAVLPFSTTPSSKHRRRPFVSCAAINISPDALVHPARAKKLQETTADDGKKQWGIEVNDDNKSVKLWFVITDIVPNSKVEDSIQVVLNHDDVLMISEKKTATKADGQRGTLDVRLLVTAGYDKVPECRLHDHEGGKVRLEVTIKKRPVKPVICDIY